MNKEFAWFLGFLLSDGCITKPKYRKKGDETHLQFCIKNTDIDVLYMIKNILGTGAEVKEYPHYKSPQAKLRIYDRMDICKDYADIKAKVPYIPKEHLRHFLRGLVDGDGCLYQSKDGKLVTQTFINQHKQIVDFFMQTLTDELALPAKNIRWVHQSNLWDLRFYGKEARLVMWWLYHGDVDGCVLERKRQKYLSITNANQNNSLTEFMTAINIEYWGNHIHMNTPAGKTLEWCHRVQHITKLKSTPVFHNKGKTKYYSLYIPTANTQSPSVEGEGIV